MWQPSRLFLRNPQFGNDFAFGSKWINTKLASSQMLTKSYQIGFNISKHLREVAPLTNYVAHCTAISGSLVMARPRWSASNKPASVRNGFHTLSENGIIFPSRVPWASPLHVLLKEDAVRWRPSSHLHAPNAINHFDIYPIVHMYEPTESHYGTNAFTKIDLAKAYLQSLIPAEDVKMFVLPSTFALWVG